MFLPLRFSSFSTFLKMKLGHAGDSSGVRGLFLSPAAPQMAGGTQRDGPLQRLHGPTGPRGEVGPGRSAVGRCAAPSPDAAARAGEPDQTTSSGPACGSPSFTFRGPTHGRTRGGRFQLFRVLFCFVFVYCKCFICAKTVVS